MSDFLTGVFSSTYYLGMFLNTAVLLIISGVGAIFPLVCGEYNLGGEGQIYFAGFVSAIALNAFCAMPAWVALPLALIITVLLTVGLTLISALLKTSKDSSVLLTSFIISAAMIPVLDSLISNQYRASSGNLLATAFIDESFRLRQLLPPSALNISIFFALPLCLIAWYVIFRTVAGRHLSLWGKAPEFARYSGYSYAKAMYLSLAVSGAMNALVGFLCVCGTYYTCHAGFYVGMGWNSLSCAMIAMNNPLLLIPSSLFLSWLYTSVDRFALINSFGFDMSGIIQALIMLAISLAIIGKKLGFVKKIGGKKK